MKSKISDLFVKVVKNSVKNEVNSACIFLGYQPKMPENVKKLRDKKDEKYI